MKLSVKTKIVQFMSGYELCYYSGNWFGFQNLPSDQKSYRTFIISNPRFLKGQLALMQNQNLLFLYFTFLCIA